LLGIKACFTQRCWVSVNYDPAYALAFSHRGYILTMGTNRYEDTGTNLINNKEIAEMFLGG
jgi:ABC-type branched-subunit amino acid transport system ATPase component